MLKYFRLCEEGQWDAALAIEKHVQAWHAGPCQHLFAKGLVDSALDRVFAQALEVVKVSSLFTTHTTAK